MNNPLPPLGLDDIRAAGPDRDSAEAFEPSETWPLSCEAIEDGHKPADVAALLMTLPEAELCLLRRWWHEECLLVANEGYGRDALCSDLLLCRELDTLCGNGWHFPMIDPATVLELLDQRAAVPKDAIATAAQWAETCFEWSQNDDDVSPEEQADRDAGSDAVDDVRAWLGTLKA